MRIKLWGTRGTVATPTAANARYGGNTPCIQVQAEDDQLIILDAGIGLHFFGDQLLAEGKASNGCRGHILLTHLHWAHIQGIPFFLPLLFDGNRFSIYGSSGGSGHLEKRLREQMDLCYCPVPNFFEDKVGAKITIADIDDAEFHVGQTRVMARRINHVAGEPCLGYRLESGGAVLAYIPDVEYLEETHRVPAVELARGADLLIHDAHYTSDEYPHHRGAGHASDADALDIAQRAGARRLLLFHHHPDRADTTIDAIVSSHRKNGLPVAAARQGEEMVLGDRG
ncbi:MBL fold metallo-hydrolase [Candidatus Latescibacterota bacterium]